MLTGLGDWELTQVSERRSSRHGIRQTQCSLSIRPVPSELTGGSFGLGRGRVIEGSLLTEKEERSGHLRISV